MNKTILILGLLVVMMLVGCSSDYIGMYDFCKIKGYESWEYVKGSFWEEDFYCVSVHYGQVEVSNVYYTQDRLKWEVYGNCCNTEKVCECDPNEQQNTHRAK